MTVRQTKRDLHDYEMDFAAWAAEQAALLRAGRWSEVDIANVAEEIESLGRSDRRAVRSLLQIVLLHLLKWQFQPDHRSKGWTSSIRNCRNQLDMLLNESPSLRRELPDFVNEAYAKARIGAAEETDLALSVFPKECLYTVEQVLGSKFLPA